MVQHVAVINKATVDLGFPLDRLTAALQKWYNRDVCPAWPGGVPPLLLYTVPQGQSALSSDWQFLFMNDADEAGALGYHDITTNNGQPISYVFAKTTIAAGEQISVTAAHELAEMGADPGANYWAQKGDGDMYALELCDAVEEDTYLVDGIPMSNFVLPAWFDQVTKRPAGTKYDFLGKLHAPFTMTKNGYVIISRGGKTKEVFGSREKEMRFANEDRRGHRSEYRKPDGLMIPGSEAERRWFDRASNPNAGGG
jgi:hypothetical protein